MAEKINLEQSNFCDFYLKSENIYDAYKESGYVKKENYGSKYYVYFLINPMDDKIFYIGKGKDKRAEGHLRENRNGNISNSKKHKIISEIVEAGLKPIIHVFENELEEDKAYAIERGLIVLLRNSITNALVCVSDKYEKRQEKAKVIQRGIIPFDVWVKIRKRTKQEISVYHSMVDQINRMVAGERFYDTATIKVVNGVSTLILS